MNVILVTLLAIAGLVAALQAVNHVIRCKTYAQSNLVMIDIVVVIMYGLVIGLVGLFEIYSGYNPAVIYAALALVVLVMILLFGKIYYDHRRSTNYKMLLVLGVYVALVAYLTIFMRIGSVDTSVRTELFDDLYNAFVQRDFAAAQHFFLNILLFIPLGYLIPSTNPRYFGRWSFAMMGGLVSSSVIEGCQLLFQLGQSDIDDVLANTLGAVIGYVLVRFVWQVRKNWSL